MIEWIRPAHFPDNVDTFFSLKNPQWTQNRLIAGLNVGFNTSELREQVNENRRIIFDSAGIDFNKVAFANQVHGNHVEEVNNPGLVADTDGLITNKKGLGLAILVADCAAILMYDEEIGYVAALHAGWRGAVSKILPETLNKFKEKGSNLKKISAFISPCISLNQFEVGEEVAAQFPEQFVKREGFAKPHIDLKQFICSQFEQFGVSKENIVVHDGCTMSGLNQYYSYRREGKNSGRMMAFIRLKD